MSVFRTLRPLRCDASGLLQRGPTFFSAAVIVALVALVSKPAPAEIIGAATVVDGDTLMIAGEKVRLFGIDAPERTQTCHAFGTTYPCGAMAIAWLVNHTLGSTVVCRDSRRDRWHRLIAVCRVDGRDLAEHLVGAGWALADRRFSDHYIPFEAAASRKRLGLWSGTFVLPLDWRRGNRTAGIAPSAGP